MSDLLQNIQLELTSLLKRPINQITMKKIKFLHLTYTLLSSGKSINRRTLFYDSVPIFHSQKSVDSLVKHYTKLFNCEQHHLNITASQKGILDGLLVFIHSDGHRILHSGKGLIPEMHNIINIEHQYKTTVVIEKDTIFNHITHQSFLTVCGKGYPCHNTIKFLQIIQKTTQILCLTDFDPYGLHIFLIYKRYINKIYRIGLGAEDVLKWGIEKSNCIKLSSADYKMLDRLNGSELAEEAEFIRGIGLKMELEILLNRPDFDIRKRIIGDANSGNRTRVFTATT